MKKKWTPAARAAFAKKMKAARRKKSGKPARAAGKAPARKKRRRARPPARLYGSILPPTLSTNKKRKHMKHRRKTRHHGRRMSGAAGRTSSAIGHILKDSAWIGGSALLGSGLVNSTPMVKDQKAGVKAAILAGIGLALALFVKNSTAKMIGAGFVTGGIMQAGKLFLPSSLNLGAGRRLTTGELAEIQRANMGSPARLGRPVTMGSPSAARYADAVARKY